MEKYEELIKKYLEKEELTIEEIILDDVDENTAKQIYEEWKKYHDEIFFHNAIYEMSYWEEPPTVNRIIKEFSISEYFASLLLEYYLENI